MSYQHECEEETDGVLHTPPEGPVLPEVDTPAYGLSGITRHHNTAPMRVKARLYGGETSWQQFRNHFERVCGLNGWCSQRLNYLWVNLTATALAYAESLPAGTVRTYEDLCQALEQRFGDSQRAEVYKSELRARQRTEGESLPALGQEIRQLMTHAYPGIGLQGLEELCIEKFREALTDSEQRMSVHRSHARTLEAAIKAAMDMESWQISERRGKPQRVRTVTTESVVPEGLTDRITKIERILEELRTSSKGTTDNVSTKSIICFYCRKPGHIARECYKKAKDTSRARPEQGNGAQLH